jgi:hypothetical protein
MTLSQSKKMVDKFQQRYPFIKTELFRSGGDAILNRIENEARGGLYAWDVVTTRGDQVLPLMDSKLIAAYRSPESNYISQDLADDQGYWTAYYVNPFVLGAGSLLAANYMFNKAEPDGLTVGNFNSGMVTQQALGSKAVRFDGRKFGWIGAPVKGFPSCMIMGFTGLKTLDDVLKASARLKFAGTRSGASGVDLPHLMNALLGTKLEVISGYKGTSETRLAMQRREADGICSRWESMRVTARSMLDAPGENKLIPFIIHGKIEDPEVRDLPQFTKVIKGDENVNAFKTWANQYDFQRPLVVPPKTPRERLQTLRTALQKTLTDREFLRKRNTPRC